MTDRRTWQYSGDPRVVADDVVRDVEFECLCRELDAVDDTRRALIAALRRLAPLRLDGKGAA